MFKKVQSLFYTKNRAWTVALAMAIYPFCGRQTVREWRKQQEDGGVPPHIALRNCELLLSGIRLWSTNVNDLGEDRELLVEKRRTEEEKCNVKGIESFVSGVTSTGLISETCKRLSTCSICLYFELRGYYYTAFSYGGDDNHERYDVRDFIANRGWIEALARGHNKEQHATNGNIMDRTMIPGRDTRESLMAYDNSRGWDMEPIHSMEGESWFQIKAEAEKYTHMSFFCDSHHGGANTYVGAGTLHQVARGSLVGIVDREIIEENVSLDRAEEIAYRKVLIGRKGYQGITVVDAANPEFGPAHEPRGLSQSWIGVLALSSWNSKHHGHIVMNDMGEAMIKILKKNPLVEDPFDEDFEDMNELINYSRTYNYLVEGVIARSISTFRGSDWRELGLKVTLYDDLRERRFTQPTGVDWAIAVKQEVPTSYIPTEQNGWGFWACAVSLRYIDYYLQRGPQVPLGVNREESWDITSSEVVVIGLGHNIPEVGCGRDIWILSHLDYPLVFAVDGYRVATIRANGNINTHEKEFVRTASLVDIHSPARYIIFVIDSDTQTEQNIGGQRFTVGQVNRFGEPIAGREAPIYPFDLALDTILMRVLSTSQCLRQAFDAHCSTYFSGGLDWMEVDNLAALLKVRWHNRASVVVNEDEEGRPGDKEYRYIPTNLCKYLGLPAKRDQDVEDYGAADAVTCLDQVFLSRDMARMTPALRLGKWNNMGELGLISGMYVYAAFDAKNREMVRERIYAGGQDSLVRAGYWRRIVESFKRQNGLRDEICSPGSYALLEDYWTDFVKSSDTERTTLSRLTNLIFKSQLDLQKQYSVWSWSMNKERTINASPTGLRTPSSWWRCELNESFCPFQIDGGANHASDAYILNTCRTDWNYNMFVPLDRGKDDYQLEAVLCRLNLEASNKGVEYLSLPSGKRHSSYGYHVETLATGMLARSAGWNFRRLDNNLVKKRWGWGLNVLIRDWPNETLKKVCLTPNTVMLMQASTFLEGTQLFRGAGSLPITGSGRNHVYRPIVTDWRIVEEMLRPGSSNQGPGLSGGGPTKGGAATPN